MRIHDVVALLVVTTLVLGTLPVGLATPTSNESATAGATAQNATVDPPEVNRGERILDGKGEITTDAVGPTVPVVIELHPNGTSNTPTLSGYGVDIVRQTDGVVQANVPARNRSRVAALPWVRAVREPRYASPLEVSQGVAAIQADSLHDQGMTGDGVRIGVIDTGFNVSNPEIADNVAGSRSFTGDLTNGGDSQHGTGTSEIVVDMAPDAELYVANVGTDVDFAAAIDWMIENDVDVISVSLGWYAAPQDGTSLVSQKATEATENDIVFVASAGNAANRHWQGPPEDPDGNGWVNFDGSIEGNDVNDGAPLQAGQAVDLYVTWNDWDDPTEDYDLYLLNSANEVIDGSEREQTQGSAPYERVSTVVPATDNYYLAVRNYDASGEETLEVFSAETDLEFRNATSSVTAPSVAVNATSVAAFHYDTGTIESFSSRGPTNDGRQGVHVAGPDGVSTTARSGSFFGTSAAAPHVAGLIALMRGVTPGLVHDHVDRILRETAIDLEDPGTDYLSGYGRVSASDAVGAAQADIRATDFGVSETSVAAGDPVVVNVSVTNQGYVSGTGTVTLVVDGDEAETRTVALGPRENTTIEFERAFETVGERRIGVSGLDSRTVSVVAELQFSDQTVTNGSTVTVAKVNASREYYLEITDGTGQVLGTAGPFPAGEAQTDLEIQSDANISSPRGVTATVYSVNEDSVLASTDAQLSPPTSTAPEHLESTDTNGDSKIGDFEVLDAIADWRAGERLDDFDILDVIAYWRTGDPITA